MGAKRYVKTTSAGNTFLVSFTGDDTLREWVAGSDGARAWNGTWTGPLSAGAGRFRTQIGPWRTEYSWRNGSWAGVEFDEHGHESCTVTLVPQEVHDGEAACTRLRDRAREVAGELRARGVPGDSCESQRAGGDLPPATTPVGGWVVTELDLGDTYRGDPATRGSTYQRRRMQVWLRFDGELRSVTLRDETVRDRMPDSPPGFAPTQAEVEELTARVAQRWDRRRTWRSRDGRDGGQVVREEWFDFHEEFETPPCATLTVAIEALLRRAG
ncbi:hypothetical protein [Blastococcus sp. SYSU DS1021]